MQKELRETEIVIGVIGCGYVGAPLLFELAKFFKVFGFDKSLDRIQDLSNGHDITNELTANQLERRNELKLSVNIQDLAICNVFIVTVPTPVTDDKVPNLSYLKIACSELSQILKKGDTIIFESTVYPGCTEEVCIPLIESASGLAFNQDFYVGYSPERINPGDKENNIANVTKVISGSNNITLELLRYIYSKIVKAGVFCAENIKTAEAAKIIENTQRDVNIALINEFAMLFSKMGLDTNQVLAAANTKWNFLPFKPGLVGGHCIGVDPYYLAHKAQELEFDPKMILSGRWTNEEILHFIARKVTENFKLDSQVSTKILILGATFKENVPDFRNSKSIELAKLLQKKGFSVEIHDPYLVDAQNFDIPLKTVQDLKDQLYDLVIIAVSHDIYKAMPIADVKKLLNVNGKIFDLKGIFPAEEVQYRL